MNHARSPTLTRQDAFSCRERDKMWQICAMKRKMDRWNNQERRWWTLRWHWTVDYISFAYRYRRKRKFLTSWFDLALRIDLLLFYSLSVFKWDQHSQPRLRISGDTRSIKFLADPLRNVTFVVTRNGITLVDGKLPILYVIIRFGLSAKK